MHYKEIPHKEEPYPNQIAVIEEAIPNMQKVGFYGLLLEMGLGKTKSALAIAEILKRRCMINRVLVVCVKAILSTWFEEIKKHSFFEDIFLYSTVKTKKNMFAKKEELQKDSSFTIINLELFQYKNKDLDKWLSEYITDKTIVILDESSKIKTITANRTLSLIHNTKKAGYKIIMTGTAYEENPLDIFSQFEFLKSGFWYRRERDTVSETKKHFYFFKSRYAILQDLHLNEGRTVKIVTGYKRIEEIAAKIAPYVTIQKLEDWEEDLPEKQYQTLTYKMSKKQETLYNQAKEELLIKLDDRQIAIEHAATLCVRLRQLSGGFEPETGRPIDEIPEGVKLLLSELEDYSGKAIIFCTFVAEIEFIMEVLSKKYGEEKIVSYYGATKNREEAIDKFEKEARFFVVNPQTGGYGLNLQFCNLMYFYSRPWGAAQNWQAEARTHRRGQKHACLYKDIVAQDTVQETVLNKIIQKTINRDDWEDMLINVKNLL